MKAARLPKRSTSLLRLPEESKSLGDEFRTATSSELKLSRTCYFGYAKPLATALGHPAFAASGLRIAVEALRSFFYPQFENALFHIRPVVNVDHPLDASIPFNHLYIRKYLEFVKLWMGTFYKLEALYGERARPGLVDFLDSIRSLYAEAGMVYGSVHTTTTRPSKNYNLRFAIIHAVDPHLDCVPSLHVILVVANWLLASELVARLGADKAASPGRGRGRSLVRGRGLDRAGVEHWLHCLRLEALEITESVLFVKQHSVNCIGASLYYLKRRFPAFTDEEAGRFVAELFEHRGGASGDSAFTSAEDLRAVMLSVCASMEKSYTLKPEEGWKAPILDFIGSFDLKS